MAELTTIGITPVGLEVIERIDAERAIRQREIEEAEAVLSEWTAKFSADSALDFYNRIVDVVHGRVARAQGVADINAVLHDTLLGVWLGFDGRTMTADIKVRPSGLDEYDAAVADLFGKRLVDAHARPPQHDDARADAACGGHLPPPA